MSYRTGAYFPGFFEANKLRPPSPAERRVLATALRSGTTGQAALAKSTGLAQQSISRLVKGLVSARALKEGTKLLSGKRGQPSTTLQVCPEFAYTFGISIMTDAVSVALMDFSGNMLDGEHCDMPSMERYPMLDKVEEIIDWLTQKHISDPKRIFGIGAGISGRYIGPGACYNTPRVLDDWALIDIDRLLSERFDRPVWVENDGNAAAVGESLVGIGRDFDNFAYLFIDTLLGGGIIVDHELMRGSSGNGGEIGLLLPKHHYQHPSMGLLRDVLSDHDVSSSSVSDMLHRFDPAWPGVNEWIEQTKDTFSLIASNLAAILDPEAIVLGGRMPRSLAKKMIPHIEIYNDFRRDKPRAIPHLLVSKAGRDACAIGAAALPFKEYFFSGTD